MVQFLLRFFVVAAEISRVFIFYCLLFLLQLGKGTPKVWRGADRQTHRQARLERHAGRQAGRHVDRQACRQTDRQADTQAGRQTDRQTGEEMDDRGGKHKRNTCTINSTTIQSKRQ